MAQHNAADQKSYSAVVTALGPPGPHDLPVALPLNTVNVLTWLKEIRQWRVFAWVHALTRMAACSLSSLGSLGARFTKSPAQLSRSRAQSDPTTIPGACPLCQLRMLSVPAQPMLSTTPPLPRAGSIVGQPPAGQPLRFEPPPALEFRAAVQQLVARELAETPSPPPSPSVTPTPKDRHA